MKNLKKFYTHLLIGFALTASAQNEFSKWYFGQQAGLDFSTSPPTVIPNTPIATLEGVANICDSFGNVLFNTDGVSVMNSMHVVMANGTQLLGHTSSTQSAIIVKQPGNTNIYYIFTVGAQGNSACYSIVDMSLAAGLGSVTVKNAPLYTPTCEKLAAVRHCNGIDIWVITHDYMSNKFRTFLLTSAGVSITPVISSVGQVPLDTNGLSAIGYIKVSPDNKKLAMAVWHDSDPPSTGKAGFYLFDFNPCSGIVSNSLTLLNASAYGVEFSPDGTKLYGVQSSLSPTIPGSVLYQWNICSPSNSSILASQYSINMNVTAGSVQWAIDSKIYIAGYNEQSLSVINNPNVSGAAMNFSLNALSIAPNMSYCGLPNYIHTSSYTKFPVPPLTNTVACQTTSFSAPAPLTFSSCPPASYPPPPIGYLWDFGEPSSGSANTSTLANPIHTYSIMGTYSVSLILYSPAAGNDTLTKIINIAIPGPTLNVAGIFNVCKWDSPRTYTVSGANSYLWSNNSTASTLTVYPYMTKVYSVSGTFNNCTLSKSFTVNVNPCTGINAVESNSAFHIFPNPFTDFISVEASASSKLLIFELSGNLVLKSELSAGSNEINTSELKAGIYFVQAKNEESVWQEKFVKVE
jgi:PKD repeat protein